MSSGRSGGHWRRPSSPLPVAEAVEVEVILWVSILDSTRLQLRGDDPVHHLHRLVLPVEDLLRGGGGGVPLGPHGNDDVGGESLAGADLGGHLERDLHGHQVAGALAGVVGPGVGGADEVLVLDTKRSAARTAWRYAAWMLCSTATFLSHTRWWRAISCRSQGRGSRVTDPASTERNTCACHRSGSESERGVESDGRWIQGTRSSFSSASSLSLRWWWWWWCECECECDAAALPHISRSCSLVAFRHRCSKLVSTSYAAGPSRRQCRSCHGCRGPLASPCTMDGWMDGWIGR
ncbi:LOW QUALITY PROTEIN: hypothetical protein U9M48_025916 [Paspalum notatum var. saurae]|uniref:Uncharacterized protein n=1 Tax=Paspalum notatum var. saurae TaxID=547442 RepID=A0AAQ3TTJ8_PASNO